MELDAAGDHLLRTVGIPLDPQPWELDSEELRPVGWDARLDDDQAPRNSQGALLEDGEIRDSADIVHEKPLHMVVREQIETWRRIGASQ